MKYKKVSEKKFKEFIKNNSLTKFVEKNRVDKLSLIFFKDSSEEIIAKYYKDPEKKETFGFSIKKDYNENIKPTKSIGNKISKRKK